jgi:hypothetical protein
MLCTHVVQEERFSLDSINNDDQKGRDMYGGKHVILILANLP